jgi:dihydroorotase-like cyclic amidohydrolase
MVFHYPNAETTFIQLKFRVADIANALALYHVAHLSFDDSATAIPFFENKRLRVVTIRSHASCHYF